MVRAVRGDKGSIERRATRGAYQLNVSFRLSLQHVSSYYAVVWNLSILCAVYGTRGHA